MRIEIHASLAELGSEAWNSLVGDASPFLEWEWLSSLEESGCVHADTGWLPQHLTFWDGNTLIAACPLYIKTHSQGEFVFDHGWADAAYRAGIRYYPKLLVASPFTPATGVRLLTRSDIDRPALLHAFGRSLVEICDRQQFSSVHVNFCLPDEIEALGQAGFLRRTGYQFQWHNRGWRDFDAYLGAFRSKRRVQIKRERRELEEQRVSIAPVTGDDLTDELSTVMFRLYKSTIDKLYWGRQYLNQKLFDLVRTRWRHRLLFFLARRDSDIVAGTFTVRKGEVLYGRYWGCFEELRHLHFNVCYYASIEYCLQQGIARFEPGAGGEFKYLRGFDPQPTESMHYFSHTGLRRAVADYLERERPAVAEDIEAMERCSPLRKEPE
ncbi:MAG TPA: GNAT family N-acetyltransferase [Terriglobales bacterium]|nr:GNAT family N-acetyltransferase [Terriglobales bacterium]